MRQTMTNAIAIGLGLLIVSALGLDILANDGEASLFLARKGLELIDLIAFWR